MHKEIDFHEYAIFESQTHPSHARTHTHTQYIDTDTHSELRSCLYGCLAKCSTSLFVLGSFRRFPDSLSIPFLTPIDILPFFILAFVSPLCAKHLFLC